MDYLKVNKNRYSVRNFSDKSIDDQTLIKIVEQAQHAPSWANAQPWKVYITKGNTLEQIKQAYRENNRQGISSDSDFYTMHRNQWGSFARQNMAKWNTDFSKYLINNRINFSNLADELFNASAIAFLTIEEFNPWSVYDLGAFGENLMLAASNEGLATIPAYEFVKYPQVLREFLPISDKEIIGMGIGLGYASDAKVNGFHSARVDTDKMMQIFD